MKLLLGLTDLWRFPITGEETWAGVDKRRASGLNTEFHHPRRSDHVTSTQQGTRFT
jgi:hypothetical protein